MRPSRAPSTAGTASGSCAPTTTSARKVGSRENEEGQIFIEPQGFCVMAGIGVGDGLRAEGAGLRPASTSTRRTASCSCNPPYTRYHLELGEISSYPPGYKENAGIFCHNNPWIMIAETRDRPRRAGLRVLRKIAPAYLEDISELHRTEPYVYSQMIAGKDAVRHGEAKNSWLTGTAAWNFVAIAHYMLGVRPELDGLRVSPCIGPEIGTFTVTRRCRGALYRIRVMNAGKGGTPRLVGRRPPDRRQPRAIRCPWVERRRGVRDVRPSPVSQWGFRQAAAALASSASAG